MNKEDYTYYEVVSKNFQCCQATYKTKAAADRMANEMTQRYNTTYYVRSKIFGEYIDAQFNRACGTQQS